MSDLKKDLDYINRFLEEREDIGPGDPLFILMIYAEGIRDTFKALVKLHE